MVRATFKILSYARALSPNLLNTACSMTEASYVRGAIFLNFSRRDHGVVINSCVTESLVLNAAHRLNALSDGSRVFCLCLTGQIFKGYWFHLNMQVKSIQQRTRNFSEIFSNCSGGTSAFSFWMTIISTWIGVHCANQHKRTGIRYRTRCTGDCHTAIFQRLPHDF